MRKLLLTLTTFTLFSAAALAQKTHVQAAGNTGFTNNCDSSKTKDFEWGIWGPDCSGGDNGGGGYNDAPVNQLNIQWGQSGNGQIWLQFIPTTALNLSASANQKIVVTIKNMKPNTDALPVTYKVRLEDGDNASLIDENLTVAATGTFQEFNLDLSSHILSGKNLSNVKKIIFIYDGCPSGTIYSGDNNPSIFCIKDFKAGSSAVVTSVADELLAEGSSVKVYPNPASGSATVSLSLKSVADVKVTVSDLLGNSALVAVNERTDAVEKTFDVSKLSAGIYAVTYQVNGAVVKTEKLVVN